MDDLFDSGRWEMETPYDGEEPLTERKYTMVDNLPYYNLIEDSAVMLDELSLRYPDLNWLWKQVDELVSERNKLDDAAWRAEDLEGQVAGLEETIETLEQEVENLKEDAKCVANRIDNWDQNEESLDELHSDVVWMLRDMSE